jgi:hypothetical protein
MALVAGEPFEGRLVANGERVHGGFDMADGVDEATRELVREGDGVDVFGDRHSLMM